MKVSGIALWMVIGSAAALAPLRPRTGRPVAITSSSCNSAATTTIPTFRLFNQQGDEADNVASAAEDEGAKETTSAEEEPLVEDPEITALKAEIEELEANLKAKKSSLSYAQDQVEEYSKAGYARAVAEMENMRRVRLTMNSSSQSNAMAGILRDFVPVYDRLEDLKVQYANDDFGKQYGGLSIGPTFTKLGCQEYSVTAGQALDQIRMNAIATEYSTTAPKDSVLEQITPGMELEGNVIRAAACVISRGSEEDEAAAAAEEDPAPESTEE